LCDKHVILQFLQETWSNKSSLWWVQEASFRNILFKILPTPNLCMFV